LSPSFPGSAEAKEENIANKRPIILDSKLKED
jgi:hypothetical protein